MYESIFTIVAPKPDALKVGDIEKVKRISWDTSIKALVFLRRVIAQEKDCVIVQYDLYRVKRRTSPFHDLRIGISYAHKASYLGVVHSYDIVDNPHYSELHEESLDKFRNGKYSAKYQIEPAFALQSLDQISIVAFDGEEFTCSDPKQARVNVVSKRLIDNVYVYEAVLKHTFISKERETVFMTVTDGCVTVLGLQDSRVQKMLSHNELFDKLVN